MQPNLKPLRPNFSSGPCVKPKNWSFEKLQGAYIGRSHRSADAMGRLNGIWQLLREILELPSDYHIAMVPGSATGAMETLFWNLLGERPVDVIAQDVFSARWKLDIVNSLKIQSRSFEDLHGKLPDISEIDFNNDVVLNWNGSTSGVRFPENVLPHKRGGLVIADVTSAIFTTPIPFDRIDACGFSWQKGLASEAAHGMIFLNQRAVDRLNTYTPAWPIPYIFKLKSQGKFYGDLFEGKTLNTPSLMVLEDFYQSLLWAKNIGGQKVLYERCAQNAKILEDWLLNNDRFEYLAVDPSLRSTSTVPIRLKNVDLSIDEQWALIRQIGQRLGQENVAFDIVNHTAAFPSLRIWCGPTVESQDLESLLPWMDWAHGDALKKTP